MTVDLAHVSQDVMRRGARHLEGARRLLTLERESSADHPRNVPDDVLDRIPENGGIVMVTFVPDFISRHSYEWMRPFKDEYGKTRGDIDMTKALPERERQHGHRPRSTLAQLCDHIDYIVKRIGIDHVGIGSDYFAIKLDKLLALTGLADSVSDAGRKLKQNAVKVAGEATTDSIITWDTGKDLTLRAGRKIKRIHFTQ